jgi:membrane-associated phospholipid phosphatase
MRLTRRTAAAVPLLLLYAACSDSPTGPARESLEREAGGWATWVLVSGSELRPAPPPDAGSEQTRQEIEEILALQTRAPAEADAQIRTWAGAPTSAWTRLAVDLLEFYWPLLPDVRTATPTRAARTMALLHVAIYEALVATWDAKFTYNRTPPSAVDARVKARVPESALPSYPSAHAAAAAAAAAILSYALPDEDTARLARLAREAGESRILAGAAYRSDVEAGWALGRAVAERVLMRAMQDGSGEVWTASIPKGDGMWSPTPPRRVKIPFDPLAGSWGTWVLERGDQFRPGPHPAPGSPAFAADLEELRRLSTERTLRQGDAARYWATDAPSIRWTLFLEEEITRRRLPALRAARAQALLSIAMYDAFVACWDAKYHYWLARPISLEPALVTVFATPPFPSYPSGHSTISAAAAEVMAYLFADAAREYREKAHEASESRVWGGVHYRFDIVVGEELGEKVGRAVVERARRDGSGV